VVSRRFQSLVPVVVLVAALATGCGGDKGGGDKGGGGGEQSSAQGGGGKEEGPLSGETKQKAEQAAQQAFPGTVKKSENDTKEQPGASYSVEITGQGGEAEVYLDKQFKVVNVKKEEGNEGGDEGGGQGGDDDGQ